ncbi:hypothetical protein [Streptomyces lomondensis]|uniref:Uncharacterized protein n=1 Tax=Streptomyces lomondensis TaxID=68229 RepID=A0ABQ2XT85_9ACTN|nr:hypothetical protein [Streptomyces lomondensis]MCF0083129.1 hypothetical protein [Streptomyces lomondensis]GGX31512.1 hypothetical protein GCM10010383_72350 [Streptomyces lomondensis]
MALRSHALLPRQYDHQKVLATTVDAWGRALWLICPNAELQPSSFGRAYPQPRTRPYDALLVINSGGTVREQLLRGVSLRVTRLDALPNGRLVLEGSGDAREHNAQIYGPDGRRRRSFAMGRAVEYLMADRRHHVWSAYFDEGVYIDPISAAGLVRWDSGGNQQWGYTPPEGIEYIDTVYAFNVDDGVAWASYYPTFPLLEARTDGQIRLRRTPVVAPAGMAVHEKQIVMLGGNRQPDRLHRCRMTEHEALLIEEACLTLPNGAPLKRYARPIGRGRHLYLRGTSLRQWYVMGI